MLSRSEGALFSPPTVSGKAGHPAEISRAKLSSVCNITGALTRPARPGNLSRTANHESERPVVPGRVDRHLCPGLRQCRDRLCQPDDLHFRTAPAPPADDQPGDRSHADRVAAGHDAPVRRLPQPGADLDSLGLPANRAIAVL